MSSCSADLLYLDRIDVLQIVASMAKEGTDLAVPTWQDWSGLNDRFAVATARGARVYATRLGWLEAAAADGVHAETLLYFAAAVEQLRWAACQRGKSESGRTAMRRKTISSVLVCCR